jgi:hypothetical protein
VSTTSGPKAKTRAKFVGGQGDSHPIEHAEDVTDVAHEDDLVGMSPHNSETSESLQAEEPSREDAGSTEGD